MNRFTWHGVVICLLLVVLFWNPSCRGSNANPPVDQPTTNQPSVNTANQNSDVSGLWGGPHITMEVTNAGAELDYDCAHGRITEKIVADREGKFKVKGWHVKERPGPVRLGQENEHPALYEASIEGDTMTLIVKLTQTDETIGTFTLTRGKSGRVFKCK